MAKDDRIAASGNSQKYFNDCQGVITNKLAIGAMWAIGIAKGL